MMRISVFKGEIFLSLGKIVIKEVYLLFVEGKYVIIKLLGNEKFG